jgi:type IV secretory pathway VirB6-like protein
MNIKQFVSFILFVVTFFSCCASGNEANFYEKCLLPSGLQGNNNILTLAPLSRNCQRICQNECEAFSRKFMPYKMLDPGSKYGDAYVEELNQDIITECYSSCQKGGKKRFSARYFEAFQATCEDEQKEDIFEKICVDKKYSPTGGCTASLACDNTLDRGYISFYKVLKTQPASVGMMCESNEDNSYGAIETEYDADAGDKFTLSLLGGVSQNQLFLCGKKYIVLSPIFNKIYTNADNMDADEWYSLRWKNKNSHRYLATLDEESFNKLKTINGAKDFWSRVLGSFYYDPNEDPRELEKKYGSKKYWKKIGKNNYTIATSAAGWGARNNSFFDTEFYIKNGDLLSIAWKGSYLYKTNFHVAGKVGGITYTKAILSDRQGLMTQCLWDDNIDDISKDICKNIWYQNSHLQIKDPDDASDLYLPSHTKDSSKKIDLFGEEYRKGGVENFGLSLPSDPKDLENQSKIQREKVNTDDDPHISNVMYGLAGKVNDIGLIKQYYSGDVTYDEKTISCACMPENGGSEEGCVNQRKNYHCINRNTFQAGEGQYSLTGSFNMPDKFEKRSKFALLHYNADIYNAGGYDLNIDWKGCLKGNGENIQYTVALKGSKPGNDAAWVDISEDQKNGVLIVSRSAMSSNCPAALGECRVFLRIKLETPPSGASDDLVDSYKYYNTHGQYYLKIFRENKSTMCSKSKGFVYKVMKTIRNTLLGTQDPFKYKIDFEETRNAPLPSQDSTHSYEKSGKPITIKNTLEIGVVGVIFQGYVQQASRIIQLLLVVFLIFTAIGYIMGFAKYTKDEFIKMVLKIALVVALLTHRSWEFFGSYMVPFFVDGSVELIAKYASSSFQVFGRECKHLILSDPYTIFSIFDGPIFTFTSADTWSRIWAICTNGLLGFFTACFLVLSVGYYFIAIVKATVMFMFAIIINSILIVMTPVFVTCILFQKTKHLFDGWVKNLFSYALQPFFVFTAIIILNFIVIMLIYYIFNFTACSKCLVRVNLGPLYDECWVTGYEDIAKMHYPPTKQEFNMYTAFSSYAMSFVGGLSIWIVTSGMVVLSSMMAGLAAKIATSSFVRSSSVAGLSEQSGGYSRMRAKKVAAATGNAAVNRAQRG